MDKTTVFGLIIGLGAVLGGAILDDTKLESLINGPAFMIVIVGTLGATALGYPLHEFMRLPGLLKRAVIEQNTERGGLVETFVALATRARRDGLLSLESEADKMTDPFLRRGVQLVVDGTDETVIRQVLEADVAATKERHQVGYSIFDTMGGFSPTLGIMGAVLGLIHVLSKVDDPTKLAAGIATAFVATLYGVGTANLIFFPMANKLRLLSEEESNLRGLMIRGILSINAGDNPRVVRQKLEAYLPPKSREAAVAKAESPQEAPALAASARR